MENLNKDPNSVQWFTRMWSAALAATEYITGSSWAVSGSDSLCNTTNTSYSSQSATALIQGGTLGTTYIAKNTITTSAGQSLVWRINLTIANQ